MITQPIFKPFLSRVSCFLVFALLGPGTADQLSGDGKVIRPRNYKGSLEEKSQEAIIIFNGSDQPKQATEDLILKIQVEGEAASFAWVIPFPNEPEVKKEDPKLFAELFAYVESRTARTGGKGKSERAGGFDTKNAAPKQDVEVLSRKTVGDFEIVTVKENKSGGLNPWLEKEGFQKLENAEDVIGFYRKKGYVFCCIKVKSDALVKERKIESHPLRFTFKTGGRDGIYFPMKMTGLQEEKFDVNLYVFYRYWLNDKLNRFGYTHRGMKLHFRDYDSRECVSNGGKSYSSPETDPYLKNYASKLKTVTRLFQKLHPGKTFYLTNIKARNLNPEDVRDWSDDLWMFPYYTNREVVPYDVQNDGPASGAWPNEGDADANAAAEVSGRQSPRMVLWVGAAALLMLGIVVWRNAIAGMQVSFDETK